MPVVKPGDTVGVGQVIGDSSAYVSAPVHASISGKVSAVRDITLCNGSRVQAVEIESDGEMRLYEGVRPPDVKILTTSSKLYAPPALSAWEEPDFPPT